MTNTNKYLEKIAATNVQHHSTHIKDKALAKQNTTYSIIGGAFGPVGAAANVVHNYASGRDTTGGLREYGRGKITGLARGLAQGVGAGAVGAATGAGLAHIVGGKAHLGAAIGGGVVGAAGAIHGAIKGEYNGRLASIRNQINEGRLKNVEKTAEFTEPDTDAKLKKDVSTIGKVKQDAVKGKADCMPDKECLDKAAGIVDSILKSGVGGKVANAGIKGFEATKGLAGKVAKTGKMGLGIGAAGAGLGAGAMALGSKNNNGQ